MKTVASSLREHLDSEVTAICTCWIITRTDGVVVRFTDADEDIFVGGIEYKSVGAYKRTAIETTSSLSVDNLDVMGITNDLVLPEQDLKNGVYDNASVEIFATSWLGSVSGDVKLRKGFFGDVSILPNGTFSVELRGLLQKLSYNYTDVFSPTCLYDLGDYNPDTGFGCRVVLSPSAVLRSTAYVVGDTVRAAQSGTISGVVYRLPIQDPSFEGAGVSGNFDSALYWRNDGANDLIATNSAAYVGTYAARGGSGSGSMYQDLDIVGDIGVSAAAVDAGGAYLTFNAWRLDLDSDQGRVQVQFIDGDGVTVLSEYDTGFESVGATWVERRVQDQLIPVGTRQVRIRLSCQIGGSAPADAFFDNLSGYIIDSTQSGLLSNTLNNVYWECTTAGTTAGSAPAFSGGVGATVNDGTVVWTARDAWTRAGRVISSSGARVFKAIISEPRAVTGWFDLGQVRFESGENANSKPMEVKSWNQTTGEIELFLSMPYNVSSGDLFSVYPGCDKTRIACAAIFGQIENAFMTPDVPGQDDVLRYPDSS